MSKRRGRPRQELIKPVQDDVSVKLETPSTGLPEASPRAPKIRQAGHYVEAKLKYNYPKKSPDQLNLFDTLSPELKGTVEKEGIRYEGIRPTPAQERIINAIFQLLGEKSENKNAKSEQFYKGNFESDLTVVYGNEPKVKPAVLRITWAELFKAYLNSDQYSGRDIADIRAEFHALSNKKYLFNYERTRFVPVGGKTEKRIDRITEAQSLFRVLHYDKDMTPEEDARIKQGDKTIALRKGELIIALNPLLTDQINSKWVEYPKDINRRTIIAAGGHPSYVTLAMNTLRDICISERSKGRTEFERNADRLPYMLMLDKYVKEGRKKLIKLNIEKAIQTCKNLNLLLEVVEAWGAEGQLKYVFKINPDFE